MSKCPVCGYWAFNGEECFDCGYRSGGRQYETATIELLDPGEPSHPRGVDSHDTEEGK